MAASSEGIRDGSYENNRLLLWYNENDCLSVRNYVAVYHSFRKTYDLSQICWEVKNQV